MSIVDTTSTSVADHAAYLYGVARLVPGIDAAPICAEAILPETSVTVVVQGDLVAFVSVVPANTFEPEEFRAASTDTAWLEARVVAHDKVLRDLSAFFDLVPLRFGTVCPDAAKVSDILARNHEAFWRTLRRIADAAEWGVKLRADLMALRSHVEASSPAIQRHREAIQAAKPGAQFFLARKFDNMLDNEVEAHMAMIIADSHRQLSAVAREAVQIPLQAAVEKDSQEAVMMNAAYLVHRAAINGFKETVARLRKALADQGLSFELCGPWPAYHFVSTDENEISDGHASEG